jgi:hypothetical protein
MIDKVLSKSFDKVCSLIDRVEKGQADDTPIELPGTFRHRDLHGKEHGADSDALHSWNPEKKRETFSEQVN